MRLTIDGLLCCHKAEIARCGRWLFIPLTRNERFIKLTELLSYHFPNDQLWGNGMDEGNLFVCLDHIYLDIKWHCVTPVTFDYEYTKIVSFKSKFCLDVSCVYYVWSPSGKVFSIQTCGAIALIQGFLTQNRVYKNKTFISHKSKYILFHIIFTCNYDRDWLAQK